MSITLNHSKRRKLKPTCHILTISQIKKLGTELNIPSLNKAMEIFNQPANIYTFNKPKLTKIHQFLLDHDLTKVKQSSRIKQPDQARLLVDLIYPGYPQGKAREQALRQERESKMNIKKPGLFAYDQLPMSDGLERLYELMRLDTSSNALSSSPIYKYTIDIDKLNLNALKDHIRLHLYFWISPRYPIFPRCSSLKLNDKETWNNDDMMIIQKGFKYIDITDKIDWKAINENENEDGFVKLEVKLDDESPYDIKYVTICSVWKKSNTDLTCQLYMQSTSTCISEIITSSNQESITTLLNQCPPKDRWKIDNTETLFLDCGRMFYQTSKDSTTDEDDEEEEIMMGNEFISLMDPILLTKIEHPTRSIFCKHVSCFDAICFFKCIISDQLWTCPICNVQIRGIQELYIDYPLKRAITSYPNESRFIYSKDGTYQTEDQYKQLDEQSPLPFLRPSSPISIKHEIDFSSLNSNEGITDESGNDSDSDDNDNRPIYINVKDTDKGDEELKRPSKRTKLININDDNNSDNDNRDEQNCIIIS